MRACVILAPIISFLSLWVIYASCRNKSLVNCLTPSFPLYSKIVFFEILVSLESGSFHIVFLDLLVF